MKKLFVATISLLLFMSCQKANQTSENTATKNAVVENILSRRSIRAYKSEQIGQEQLDTIMKCAINAPSAKNQQPWEIRIIQNTDLLKKLNTAFNTYTVKTDPKNEKAKDPNHSIFYHAPTLVIIAKDKTNPYSDFDCGLLSQNMMLSAKSIGIGSVCLGYLSRYLIEPEAKDFVAQLNLPDSHQILMVVALGYPTDQWPDAKPREDKKVQYLK